MVNVDSLIKLHTLISLDKSERHGYELMKELETKLDKKISAANIYPFLKELKQNKMVTLKQNGREKIYRLTAPGKNFVNVTLLRFHDIIQESLQQKLTKCTHCGCEVYNNKYTETVRGKKLAFCCCHCAESYKKGMYHG